MSEDRQETPQNAENSSADIASSPQFSDMLNKVLSNPQIISTVASALSGVGKEAQAEATQAKPSESPEELSKDIQDKIPEVAKLLAPLISSKSASEGAHADKRSCLLSAIKPYVSKERADAIDYMIKFSRLSEILKGMI